MKPKKALTEAAAAAFTAYALAWHDLQNARGACSHLAEAPAAPPAPCPSAEPAGLPEPLRLCISCYERAAGKNTLGQPVSYCWVCAEDLADQRASMPFYLSDTR